MRKITLSSTIIVVSILTSINLLSNTELHANYDDDTNIQVHNEILNTNPTVLDVINNPLSVNITTKNTIPEEMTIPPSIDLGQTGDMPRSCQVLFNKTDTLIAEIADINNELSLDKVTEMRASLEIRKAKLLSLKYEKQELSCNQVLAQLNENYTH